MGLSSDPRQRRRKLANFVPGARTVPPGNRRAARHGGYATIAVERLEAKIHEVHEALAAGAPLRDADGELRAADSAVVRLFADSLCHLTPRSRARLGLDLPRGGVTPLHAT